MDILDSIIIDQFFVDKPKQYLFDNDVKKNVELFYKMRRNACNRIVIGDIYYNPCVYAWKKDGCYETAVDVGWAVINSHDNSELRKLAYVVTF